MHVTERTARSEMPRIRNQQVGVEARGSHPTSRDTIDEQMLRRERRERERDEREREPEGWRLALYDV